MWFFEKKKRRPKGQSWGKENRLQGPTEDDSAGEGGGKALLRAGERRVIKLGGHLR